MQGFAEPSLRRIIRRQQEHRQRKDQEPDAGQRPHDAIALMCRRIEPEQRCEAEQGTAGLGICGKKAENKDEAENTADIAGGPAGAGQPPDLFGRHQRWHHRVVEHDSEFGADGSDRVSQKQSRNHADVAGTSEPHKRGTNHQKRTERRDPRLAAATGIRDGAEHRRKQGYGQSSRSGRKAP